MASTTRSLRNRAPDRLSARRPGREHRRPGRLADDGAVRHARGPAIPRSSTPRSASPTGAPGRTPRRTRSTPSPWRCGSGATGLETDVWLTADGVPVLDHDGVVRRRGRQRPIAAVTEVGAAGPHPDAERAPAALRSRTSTSSIDICDPAAGPLIIARSRPSAPTLLPRLWLCRPDVPSLVALRPLDPQVKLVNSTRLDRMKEGPERRAATLREPSGSTPSTSTTRTGPPASSPSSTASSATAWPGTSSTSTCCGPRWPWASTASSATGSTA